jgi:hypothetical protein
MKRLTVNTCIALALGLGLTLALLWLLGGGTPVIQAQGPDGYSTYYVAPSCAGVPDPCFTTVQAAVDAADDPGDVVKVAAGIYTGVQGRPPAAGYRAPDTVYQVVYIDKTVTVRGGYTTTFTDPPDPEANLTTLDAQSQGRVLYITGDISPTVEGLRLTGGDADGLGGTRGDYLDVGGGVYVISATATIRDNQVVSNTAEYYGGGLFLFKSDATLVGNTVTANSATYWGGGLYLGISDATLNGNTVSDNYALNGGGLRLEMSDATLSDNVISGNSAGGGGGLWLYYGNVTLIGNIVSANSANEGGGLSLGRSNATLINNIIVDNQANSVGSGLLVTDNSSPRLLHTTLARNTGGDGSGIHVSDEYGEPSTVALTNTILVSHTVGVYVDSDSTVLLEGTLWGSGAWANGSDWGGDGTVITGTVNVWGDPTFVDPDAGDYHIGPSSDALNKGVDAGVSTDIDNEPRFYGDPDLGADEYWPPGTLKRIYLPWVFKNH